MSEKKLPIQKPPIHTYLHYAHDLEILLACEHYLPSFHMNFIQVNFLKNHFDKNTPNRHYMEFYYIRFAIHSWLLREAVTFEQLTAQGYSVPEFIMNSIDSGHYIRIMVDEFYLPPKASFKERHFEHFTQVFGYNREEKIFYITGFDAAGIYGTQKVSFDDFEKSTDCSDRKF